MKSTRIHQRRRATGLLAAAALAVTAAACGGDDDADDAANTTTTTEAAASTTEPGEAPADTATPDTSTPDTSTPDGATDDTTPGTDAPGTTAPSGAGDLAEALAPQPLAETETVRLSFQIPIESYTHILLAKELGEFERENLNVEFVSLASTDAIPQLMSGDLEAVVGAWSAGSINAIAAGADMRSVTEFGVEPQGGAGIYVINELAEQGPAALEGQKIGSAVGLASFATLFLEEYLQQGGLDITDIQVEQLPGAEVPTAMNNGAVAAAYLTAPSYLQVAETAQWVAGPPSDFSGSALFFGKELLDERPEIADAVVRAILRTSATYLQGDYKFDPEIQDGLAAALQVGPDVFQRTPSLIFDPAVCMRADILTSLQETWLKVPDILRTPEPLTPDQLLDTSVTERVLGFDPCA